MPPNNGWQTQPSERNLLNEINAYRSQYGKTAEARQPVYTNGALSQAAQSHANYMAQTGNFSHRGEGRSTPATRASSFGYKWTAIAENIAWGQSSVQEAVRTWAGSFGHNRNMLGDFQHIGIGIAADQNGRIYWVTVFGNE
tara:strand:- start:2116 stop:2538 length:423 start_codon:yes stop_codon:yes gene_type:complete